MDATLAAIGRVLAIGIAFGLVVLVHEGGHFIAARLAGMAVHEFSIGFGRPRLFGFKRGETEYSFRLWPFFSYVRIAGMEPGDDHPRGFPRKSRPAQAAVLVMGCLMNFLLAALIFMFIGGVYGLVVPANTVDQVLTSSPAAQSGLRSGDKIVGVEGRTGLTVEQIRKAIASRAGKPLVLEIERRGTRLSLRAIPRSEIEYDVRGLKLIKVPIGRIGVVFAYTRKPMGLGQSIAGGFVGTYEMIQVQLAGLIALAMKRLPPELEPMGPVGVVHVMYRGAKQSWWQFLEIFGALTVAIGFINLLPFPPLDGARLVIVGLEAIRRKPFDKRKELMLHLVGFAVFLGLAVLLTFKDVLRIVSGRGP